MNQSSRSQIIIYPARNPRGTCWCKLWAGALWWVAVGKGLRLIFAADLCG